MRTAELSLDSLDLRYGRLRVADRRRQARLLASIEEHGQQDPICVVAEGDGRYVVIDGHKRVRALRRLRRDVARAVVVDMDPAQALAAAYRAGSAGGYDAIEEGWLVYELHRVGKWALGKTAAAIGRSKSWASRRLALVEELPDWLAREVACGQLGAHAAANYLVPLTRGNAEDGRLLAENISGLGLSERQLGVLCASYRAAGAATRRRIVSDPARFLKVLEARAAGPQDPALSEAENRVFKQLELVGNVALGLTRGLPQVLGYDAGEAARAKLWSSWERAAKRWTLLEEVAAGLSAAEGGRREVERDQSGATDGGVDPARAGSQQPQDSRGPGAGAQRGPRNHRERSGAGEGAAQLAAPAGAVC
ncbi:MAG: ParB N-terminal domain-containing protein [Elusimicrobia bacterium]|nr:ParB N-terminal domain-containing protein [Elusimicrobiota bacterium]